MILAYQAASLSEAAALIRNNPLLNTTNIDLVNDNFEISSLNKTPNFNISKIAYLTNAAKDSLPSKTNITDKEKNIKYITVSKLGKNNIEELINN